MRYGKKVISSKRIIFNSFIQKEQLLKKLKKKNLIIEISKDQKYLYQLPLFRLKDKFLIDENGNIIDKREERFEQYLVYKYILKNDVVLEVGGRYGIVSNTINLLLKDKTQHVVIEPDKSVIQALTINRNQYNSKYTIVNCAISNYPELYLVNNEYGTYVSPNPNNDKNTKIDTISSYDFFTKYPLKFNVLIVDCEGCIENFLIDNIKYLNNLELIIFEKDNLLQCDYSHVYQVLKDNKFYKHDCILLNDDEGFQQVWIKKLIN